MFRSRPTLHLFTAVALVCLLHLLAFQGPLLRYANSVSAPGFGGFIQITSLQMLQFCLLASFLMLIGTLSQLLFKLISTLLMLTNAAALYFMNTYGIEIDLSMIANILNTDSRETSNLLHWSIFVYLGGLGLLPGLLLFWVKLVKPRWVVGLVSSVGVFALLLAFLVATSFTWLWYDAHATRMGARILPWSYVVNSGRYLNRYALRNREVIRLPDATFAENKNGRKQAVILVLGEAARADNFALYGYDRDTNPFTMQTDLVALPAGLSCATYTIGSAACILTHEGRDASARTVQEPLPTYLTRHGVETVWRSNNSGPPPLEVTQYQRAREIVADCAGDDCPDGAYDAALNWGVADLIAKSDAERIFIGLHQTGSHGPSYFKKYPPEFAHFQPICETVQVSDCSQEALYNAYDNTLRYSDFLIADLIAQLESLPDTDSVLIYVSDHGQSLGEGGLYLHGTPPAIAPDQQRRVPFLVWMSKGFTQSHGVTKETIMRDVSFPHDFPFHSVMGAFGMRSNIYKPQYDIFSGIADG
ncbi:sulfatase-like hydrolase/transferase [Yoonia sediminilitoris]|uniref:sulfatase-like hydrolase/transferase n=1 Tax=Yoonia sediminilitoris TaxID=1286148 RepID=UPI00145586AF|nr:sulfatase-like hydrolase/transferase [Yoonia sediminilitoris]